MLYTDVGRELGRRWALVGAEEKNVLKKQAEDFNKALKEKEMPEDDYLDPVPSTSGVGTGTNEFEINNDDIRVEIGDETSAAIDDELNASNQNYVNVDDLLNLSIEDIQPDRKRKKTVENMFTFLPGVESAPVNNKQNTGPYELLALIVG